MGAAKPRPWPKVPERVAGLAMTNKPSVDFSGVWPRRYAHRRADLPVSKVRKRGLAAGECARLMQIISDDVVRGDPIKGADVYQRLIRGD